MSLLEASPLRKTVVLLAGGRAHVGDWGDVDGVDGAAVLVPDAVGHVEGVWGLVPLLDSLLEVSSWPLG
jgi:hypothetical protein